MHVYGIEPWLKYDNISIVPVDIVRLAVLATPAAKNRGSSKAPPSSSARAVRVDQSAGLGGDQSGRNFSLTCQ